MVAAEAAPPFPGEKLVVFYRRASAWTEHGRTMALAHEEELFAIVRAVLKRFDRTEKLVAFNGEDPATGKSLSYARQFDVFSVRA